MHKLFRASNAYLSHFHGRGDALAFTAGELRTPSRRAASGAQARHPQISHPWPEWVNLMELLLSRGYFGAGNEIPLQSGELGRTESNLIRTACLNFSRDRFDIIRLLSHKNIRVIAACGCPNLDRKVINAGKRLRAHVGVDEEDTCRSCRLRENCGRAFVKAREDEGARTVDIMRIILSYGLDQFLDTVRKELCLDETVEKSVRILLKEMVECSERALESNLPKSGTSEKVALVEDDSISLEKYPENGPMKTGEWLCPKCKFLNFAKNIKCSRCDYLSEVKLAQFKLEQEHLPLLKGDWICSKCNFLNFARNTRCGICKEKPPKRQLSPGEWECPSCNYINFRRNMVCLKCDHRRPKMANSANTSSENLLTNTGAVENAGVNARTCAQQRSQMGYGERSCLKSSDRACDFVDFPISGGSSDLSRNAEKIERWKLEMRDRSKGIVKVIKNGEFRPRGIPRSLENVSDVEDVADWFNPKKTESCLAR